ncbi:MAG: hypothetical protein SW833_10460 [Cyanobacteriota bacterium]|nr:hypothetical protein [Cyanobacteriota bacterium]
MEQPLGNCYPFLLLMAGEKFPTLLTTKPIRKGGSLGLNIARRILERDRGTIEVKDVTGQTPFKVMLAIARILTVT